MTTLVRVVVLALALALTIAVPRADVWDLGTDNDNAVGTTINELTHGSTQVHDLAVLAGVIVDVDFYRIGLRAGTSWEILVDGTSTGLGIGANLLQLVDSGGVPLLPSIAAGGVGISRALRLLNNTLVDQTSQLVRVGDAACALLCTSATQYHILARETTVALARFNNNATQVTVLMTQNLTTATVNATAIFYDAAGTRLHAQDYTIPPHGLNVMPTSTIPALAGVSGALSIVHDAPYAGINAKAVALEPATGFSFDTPGVYKPY
jgi:hypothetical protein